MEATWYEENATCERTVTVANAGGKNSGVISDFYALCAALPVAGADVYCSRGSDNDAADFTLLKAKQTVSPLRLACEDGRSTGEFLPYFNLSGKEGGAVLGIGWTGLWAATFQSLWGGRTRAEVKQKELAAYLEPDEAVRSPLVSLSFYGGSNPVKGFNRFRDWVKDCVYPENAPRVQNNMDILFVRDHIKPWRNESGILIMGIPDFLLDHDSLNRLQPYGGNAPRTVRGALFCAIGCV